MDQTMINNTSTDKAWFSPPTWEEIRGSENWKVMWSPWGLNQETREFVLKCGDLCQAAYDALVGEEIPQMSSFFDDAMLQNASDYQVCSYLFAPSGFQITRSSFPNRSKETHWMGYVAITTDDVSKKTGHREIYVVWRGTSFIQEAITDVLGAISTGKLSDGGLVPQGDDEPTVHQGWLKMYTTETNSEDTAYSRGPSVRAQLHNVIKELIEKYQNETEKLSLVVAGHSLGGALATLSAFDLVENKVICDKISLVSTIIFACPQVGNEAFKKRVRGHDSKLKILHVKNFWDAIPLLPDFFLEYFVIINTADLTIDTAKSPYLENPFSLEKFQSVVDLVDILKSAAEDLGHYILEDAAKMHSLEATLHVVAWWNGSSLDFGETPKVNRSLPLVNKWTNFLKKDLHVPASWWAKKDVLGKLVFDEFTREWFVLPNHTRNKPYQPVIFPEFRRAIYAPVKEN